MKILNIITALFLIVGFLSCTGEPKVSGPEIGDLIGKWELQEAFINNKPTERLNDAYLHFKEDGTMATNILGKEEVASYEMIKKTITQKTTREVKYEIEKLEGKDLNVIMNLSSRKFQLKLSKVE